MVVPRRHELTDAEWALLESLLPPQRGHGRPCHDHRRILNGILFVLHTGVPWRDLPERDGPWPLANRLQPLPPLDRAWPLGPAPRAPASLPG
jgi:transposase